ncbi:MAG TPA: NF038122 family metalloprotease [Thermoanaerobaculia bacterium]
MVTLTVPVAARERGLAVTDRGGAFVCRPAAERLHRVVRAEGASLRVLDEGPRVQSGGLNIILRATPQLENFPEAKAAFVRAAARWEARISNPVTVYVDVDFGPTLFGEPFGSGVVGFAIPDDRVSGEGAYSELRRQLVAHADDAAEAAVLAALPEESIPTDVGPTTRYASPSALLRVLGILPAVASPSDPAPAIGFNSAYAYDFDPADGITGNRNDFEGIVVHEIGHMLGFVSKVGDLELGAPVHAPAVLDLFRFRPGVTMHTFATAPRIVSSGGEQVYFAGAEVLPLSTGRDDGSGGDRRSASHWKDDTITGTMLGIMDPTVKRGTRLEITPTDLEVLDLLGYTFVEPAPEPPRRRRPVRS